MTDEPMPVDPAVQAVVESMKRASRVVPDPQPDVFADVADDLAAMRAEMVTNRWQLLAPRRFRAAQLGLLDDKPREVLGDWCVDRPGNLVLFGPVGTGKTFAALAAARELLPEVRSARFLPVVELLDMLRPGGPENAMAELCGVELLVLDDLGHERPTDWTAERLGALVNRRWMEERPIIATSNLEPRELRTAIGDRTYSRLVGSGATVLSLSGDDRRRGK